MRITGGQSKGRSLATPKGLNIRPTTDQVREAIFSIIGQDLSGIKVLDLFAGTGSLGLEALSRGAQNAIFIDNSQQAINLLKKNLALSGFQESGSILKRDLKKGFPRGHPLLKVPFDIIFLDPPYRKGFIPLLLEDLSVKDVLSASSQIIAESSKKERLPIHFGNLKKVDSRVYGDTMISFYNYEAE